MKGSRREDERGTGGPPEGVPALGDLHTAGDQKASLEHGGGGWLWQPGSHSRHQRGGRGCGGPVPASCRHLPRKALRSESCGSVVLNCTPWGTQEHQPLLKPVKEETGNR